MGFESGHIEKGMVDLRQGLPALSIEEINFLLYFIDKRTRPGYWSKNIILLKKISF